MLEHIKYHLYLTLCNSNRTFGSQVWSNKSNKVTRKLDKRLTNVYKNSFVFTRCFYIKNQKSKMGVTNHLNMASYVMTSFPTKWWIIKTAGFVGMTLCNWLFWSFCCCKLPRILPSHTTKIYFTKKKKKVNKIWHKVAEHDYIYIFKIKFEKKKKSVLKWRPKTKFLTLPNNAYLC